MNVDLYYAPECADETPRFAQWCQLHNSAGAPQNVPGYALWLDRAGLALLCPGHAKPYRLTADFLDARGQGKSLLVQACGGRAGVRVLDPFGGFGIDALVLARAGCDVTVVERHPIVWLMLREFAADLGETVDAACDDGVTWLADATRAWDVVYLDPMFPARRKRALPSRGLQHLRELSGDEIIDLEEVIELALARATARVVLKRRRKDPVNGKPAYQIKGRSIRFDVYV